MATETKRETFEDAFDEILKAILPVLGQEPPRLHATYKFLAAALPDVPAVLDAEGKRKLLAAQVSNLAGQVTAERKAVMGDFIKFERLSSIFHYALPSSFKHCTVDDVAAEKPFARDLYYDFDNLPWKGSVKTNAFMRATPIFGRNLWKEYRITLANDGFLFLEPRLLGLEPLSETTTHHPKYQTRTKWYIMGSRRPCPPVGTDL